MVAQVGMVGSYHKEGILVPRHRLRLGEELTQGIVCIADALVDDDTLFREYFLILFRDDIRMMRRGGEECSHKRLLHLAHLRGIELHERLIPDGPGSIKILVAIKSLIGIVFRTTEIIGESRGAGKCLESHRTILCPMEEG